MDNSTNENPAPTVEQPPKRTESYYESPNVYMLHKPLDTEGNPFQYEGEVKEWLKLRKPKPTECVGLNLVDIGTADITTVLDMLKRSADLGDAVYDLDLPVITEAAGVFKRFFTTRSVAGSTMSAK